MNFSVEKTTDTIDKIHEEYGSTNVDFREKKDMFEFILGSLILTIDYRLGRSKLSL